MVRFELHASVMITYWEALGENLQSCVFIWSSQVEDSYALYYSCLLRSLYGEICKSVPCTALMYRRCLPDADQRCSWLSAHAAHSQVIRLQKYRESRFPLVRRSSEIHWNPPAEMSAHPREHIRLSSDAIPKKGFDQERPGAHVRAKRSF